MIQLFDLPREDVLFKNIFSLLDCKDLLCFSSTCSTARDGVHVYFSMLKKIKIADHKSRAFTLVLQKIVQHCAGLRILKIRNSEWIDDITIGHVFAVSPRLEMVDFSECVGHWKTCFLQLGLNCRGLKILNFSSCGKLGNAEIDVLIEHLNSAVLEEIGFASCHLITNDSLSQFMMRFTMLKRIRLSFLRSTVNDATLICISRYCPQLEHFDVTGCSGITDHGIKSLYEYSKCLTSLKVRSCQTVTESSLRPLRQRGSVSIDVPPPPVQFNGGGINHGILMQGILRIVGYSRGGIDTYFYEAFKDWKSIITKLI